jgi:hypothetical protein
MALTMEPYISPDEADRRMTEALSNTGAAIWLHGMGVATGLEIRIDEHETEDGHSPTRSTDVPPDAPDDPGIWD